MLSVPIPCLPRVTNDFNNLRDKLGSTVYSFTYERNKVFHKCHSTRAIRQVMSGFKKMEKRTETFKLWHKAGQLWTYDLVHSFFVSPQTLLNRIYLLSQTTTHSLTNLDLGKTWTNGYSSVFCETVSESCLWKKLLSRAHFCFDVEAK